MNIPLGHPIANDPLYGKGRRATVANNSSDDINNNSNNNNNNNNSNNNSNNESTEGVLDEDCSHCMGTSPSSNYLDPDEEQLSLWLHAFSYEANDWKFETELPSWASSLLTDYHPTNNRNSTNDNSSSSSSNSNNNRIG